MTSESALRYQVFSDHRSDGLRSGEGSMLELKDGGILFCFTAFQGSSDESSAHIAHSASVDGGMTWTAPELLFAPPRGALNAMSVSLTRLDNGDIGCSYLVKWSTYLCVPVWTTSRDQGRTWSPPVNMTADKQYFSINNDRFVRLRDGTLVIPYSVKITPDQDLHNGKFSASANKRCGFFYSTDHGETWKRSDHEVTHTPDMFTEPQLCLEHSKLHPDVAYLLENRLGILQEPGIEQLRDGRLLMYMRSSYAIYHCIAETLFFPWTKCTPLGDFSVCCGPQTMRRDPVTGHLLLFYNDRGRIPFGTPEFRNRTPLSLAVSKDEGKTWQRLAPIETEDHNYCYYSVLFLPGRFVLSYYESANNKSDDGAEVRRNLASLKICSGPSDYFQHTTSRR